MSASVETIRNIKILVTTETAEFDITSKDFDNFVNRNKNLRAVEIIGISDHFYPDNTTKSTILKTKMKIDYIKTIEVAELDNMLAFKINDGKTYGIIEYQDIEIFKKFYEKIWMVI